MPPPPFHIQNKLRQAFELMNAGRDEEAGRVGKDVLRTIPKEPNALYLMGVLHHKAGELKDAAKFFEKSYKADKSNLASYSGIGIVRLDQERFSEAARIFADLSRSMQRDPVIANNLGLAYKGLEDYGRAIDAFRKAISLRRDFADAYANLGALLSLLGENKEAIDVLEQGNRACPGNSSILLHLGTAQALESDSEIAVETLRDAVRHDPTSLDARRRLATILVNRGSYDEARGLLDACLKDDAEDPVTYFDLADLIEARRREEDLSPNEIRQQGLTVYRNSGAAIADTPALLNQRLAQSLEEVEEYDAAFRHYHRAQSDFRRALAAMGKRYDRREVEDVYSDLMAYFDQNPAAVPDSFSDGPIFIVGMPRSGTSLLEQVLASHPDIYGAGELLTLPDLIHEVGAASSGSGYADLLTLIGKLDDGMAAEIASEYLERLPEDAKTHRFVSDKLPVNFINTGLIRRMFPTALILNTLRHPLDNGWSIFVQKFGSHLTYDHDLGDTGHYFAQYDRLMKYWRNWDSSILPIRYEDTVSDMQGTIMPILDQLGLDWDPAMARFFENDREVHTASRLQVRRPIYTSSVARWRRFEPWLGPMMKEMGDLPKDYEEGKI